MHRCSRCNELKGPTAFHRDPRNRSGLRGVCRTCNNTERREARRRGTRAVVRQQTTTPCERCRDRQHGVRCLGVSAGCGCRCRPMLGLEGPFEFGDPTAPAPMDREIA